MLMQLRSHSQSVQSSAVQNPNMSFELHQVEPVVIKSSRMQTILETETKQTQIKDIELKKMDGKPELISDLGAFKNG